jgi:hypothetical protein
MPIPTMEQYIPPMNPGMPLAPMDQASMVHELPPTANKAKWHRNYDLLADKDR